MNAMCSETIEVAGCIIRYDTRDKALVDAFNWRILHANGHRYAIATRNGQRVLMHRLIVGAGCGLVVDHINNDGLDNRRLNLRVCRQMQNLHNRAGWRNAAVPFKGVARAGNKFRANIMCDGVAERLGVYATAEDAARAYDCAAIRLHGEFAWTNFGRNNHGSNFDPAA